ncbi:hypothetical protein K466DRAFT_391365 [Polyporus arcularius HHB13444]|uniref:Uncharacterized protein n=1 Tax=Polyporus arcularius HHB13444 TaxID=1314778 RepID=A0A5C3NRH9_9APHY|nr:hypothetical protein K466DRAFT_391365 [Polyporus arcularius HHB13444]
MPVTELTDTVTSTSRRRAAPVPRRRRLLPHHLPNCCYVRCFCPLRSSFRWSRTPRGERHRAKYSSTVFSAALKKSPQVLNKVQTKLNAIHSAVK